MILLTVALAACGGSDDSRPASSATRPEPATQRTFWAPWSPDAGISEGHAVADERARRCRAEHPRRSRAWQRCFRRAR
jgi:ABC-type glycerol-3-phosphate transport system substrate-binding protein